MTEKTTETKSEKREIFAVVRIRGTARVRRTIESTMKMLNIKGVNRCSVVPANEKYKGMIMKAKDYVTWGELKKEVFEKMLTKRGEIIGDGKLTEEYLKSKKYTTKKLVDDVFAGKIKLKDVGVKPYFRLHPPRKGHRGSIKRPFTVKGALGYRGDKINELLEKMI